MVFNPFRAYRSVKCVLVWVGRYFSLPPADGVDEAGGVAVGVAMGDTADDGAEGLTDDHTGPDHRFADAGGQVVGAGVDSVQSFAGGLLDLLHVLAHDIHSFPDS